MSYLELCLNQQAVWVAYGKKQGCVFLAELCLCRLKAKLWGEITKCLKSARYKIMSQCDVDIHICKHTKVIT